jgi:hypothetical protein
MVNNDIQICISDQIHPYILYTVCGGIGLGAEEEHGTSGGQPRNDFGFRVCCNLFPDLSTELSSRILFATAISLLLQLRDH